MRLFTLIFLFIATSSYSNSPSRAVPEAFTGLNYQKAAFGSKAMISAANPHAVNAGIAMFERGGNAIDAAVAIQIMLTLVEPQSSGIGGGAFMLWYDAKKKILETYDGREKAPSKATPNLFIGPNGRPIKWIDAVIGGRSVGVPGVLKMLHQVHSENGALPWGTLFKPTIELAEKGFAVSPRLAKLVAMKMNPGLAKLSPAKEYFYPNGEPIKEGQLLRNLEYAATLRTIANNGIEAFYEGVIAKHIVTAVQNAQVAPGLLSLADLKNYESVKRAPVCIDYRASEDVFQVCSMAPPSSGGLTVLQILKLLEPFELTKHEINSAETIHLYSQAARLAFADRNRYLADSDFVQVPVKALIDDAYLDRRRQLIKLTEDMGRALPGVVDEVLVAANVSIEQPNTSHLSIVDEDGNAVSMTTSIEMGFGSTVMVDGFLLNNQLTDFSLVPEKNGLPVANRVQGSKRPRSSMTPVIVFKDGEVYAVLGSPGGSRIINYVGYALVGLLDYGLDMQTVVNLPRVSNRNRVTTLEKTPENQAIAKKLRAMGHKVKIAHLTSGIHGILKTPRGWQGAADPRREGTAVAF